jgi:DNA repair exonuclease SbcCD ATPase subunit
MGFPLGFFVACCLTVPPLDEYSMTLTTETLTTLAEQVGELTARLQTLLLSQDKLTELLEQHTALQVNVQHLQEETQTTQSRLTTLQQSLLSVEQQLLQDQTTQTTKAACYQQLHRYLPILVFLCAAMFVLGTVVDDMKLVHEIFG